MKRGVVLELTEGRATVLDTGGGFHTLLARSEWRVGSVVRIVQARRRLWLTGLAACLAVIISLGTGAGLWFTQTALVSLDVNPSIELRLNRFDRVISARALNEAGETALNTAGVEGLACGAALSNLLGALDSYFVADAFIALTVQAENADRAGELLALVNQTAENTVQLGYPGVSVECHGVDGALVEEAHGHGVTAGKYLALLELQKADPQLDLGAYTHCSIGEIKAETVRCQAQGHESGVETGSDNAAAGGNSDPSGGHGGRHGYGHHGA